MIVICLECNKVCKNIQALTSHIRSHKLSTRQYYNKFLKKNNEGFCQTCGKETNFISIKLGYCKFCSSKCVANNNDVKTNKIKTSLLKFGCSHPRKSEIVKEKAKITIIEKYGVENVSQIKEVKDKKVKKAINKYNVDNVFKNEEIKEKSKKTIREKYGVDYPLQNSDILNKVKNSNFLKYGVNFSFSSESVKRKILDSNYKKYGVEYPLQNKDIKEKTKNTNILKYKKTNPFKCKEFKDKYKQTMMNNYGVENPSKCESIIKKRLESYNKKFLDEFYKILKHLDIEILDYYISAYFKHNWKCLKCKNEFVQSWNRIQQGYKCPTCFPRLIGKSMGEIELYNFLSSLINEDINQNNRYEIKPYELDIYIPGKKLGVEFNGVYWHSENFIDFEYHINKTNLCKEKGIRLIHVFEDEWIFKKEIVKNRLKQILGISNSTKINARDCIIKEIDPKTKNSFLDKYHLQGKDSSVIKLGAFYNNELISVMTFSYGNISKGSKKQDNIWELNRFCSNYNYHIPGIAGKLLEHFKRNYKWKEIFSYADKRWSDGNLYYRLGFEHQYDTKPNYWYVSGFKRIHRFNLRKNENDPKDIPEWVLRESEGYFRIWDCGNMKFEVKNV